MSDLPIFIFGCIVTIMIGVAVTLLVWGASEEPSGEPSSNRE